MADLATALFGAMEGGGNAVADIAADKRKALAEKLKMQAQNDLAMMRQESQNKFTAGQNEKELIARQQQSEADIQSREKTSALERKSREKIAGMRMEGSAKNETTDINAQKQIQQIYSDLTKSKDKGGYGWEEGKQIPPRVLEQINYYRQIAGQEPLVEQKGSDKTWYGRGVEKYSYVPRSQNKEFVPPTVQSSQPQAAAKPLDWRSYAPKRSQQLPPIQGTKKNPTDLFQEPIAMP